MAQRYIYLSDELNAKLKLEENASGLICQLLNDYYKLGISRVRNPQELEDLKKQKVEIVNKEIEIIDKEMSIIHEAKQLEEQEAAKIAKKKQEFWNTCKSNLNEISYNIITDEIIDEYVERFNNDPELNMYDFITEKEL